VLNWLAAVLLAAFGILLIKVTYKVVVDTMDYSSTAPTPWATPLIYPQGAWFITLAIFGVIATLYALHATRLIFTGRIDELNKEFHPKGAMEELSEEMEDLDLRTENPDFNEESKGDQ
ncbi:MAG: TRAP transporter small permease, partial [Gammaproteobacteria bacterium]|nr:TRAP transporter small permease [Gammaproteobacteria bacterium]